MIKLYKLGYSKQNTYLCISFSKKAVSPSHCIPSIQSDPITIFFPGIQGFLYPEF